MFSTQISLLKKYGLKVRGLRGQHLLVDPNIQRKIIQLLDPRPNEWILEIGPGLGALTAEILAAGACVIALEKEKRFCEILEGELGGDYKGKLWVENADVLKTDLPKLLKKFLRVSLRGPAKDLWRRGRKGGFETRPYSGIASAPRGSPPRKDRRVKVVSNLPYYVTSPILFWLVAHRAYVEKAVLMMQREVAKRLLAQPGDKDYSRLTLALRYHADVHRAFDVSRNCFTPKPTVDSTVLTLDFYPPSKLPQGIDERFLFHLIQVAFGARRKTLLNRLAQDPQIGKSRQELVEILRKLGIPKEARAESLLLKDFISLAESLGVRPDPKSF